MLSCIIILKYEKYLLKNQSLGFPLGVVYNFYFLILPAVCMSKLETGLSLPQGNGAFLPFQASFLISSFQIQNQKISSTWQNLSTTPFSSNNTKNFSFTLHQNYHKFRVSGIQICEGLPCFFSELLGRPPCHASCNAVLFGL